MVTDAMALGNKCPTCGASPGVWCGAGINGPWMHERRYKMAEKEREMSKFSDTNDYGYADKSDDAREGVNEMAVKHGGSKADALAAHLEPKTLDPFEDGDVVKFKVRANGRTYSYAALRAADRWYATGNTSLVPSGGLSFKAFMAVLNRDEVSGIEHSTGWAKVQ